jgi:nucleotide-binding universal stress UspA family protein
MYRKIVLAYDGSEAGQKALLDSQDIGQWSQSEIVLVAVIPNPVTSIAAEMWAYSPAAGLSAT